MKLKINNRLIYRLLCMAIFMLVSGAVASEPFSTQPSTPPSTRPSPPVSVLKVSTTQELYKAISRANHSGYTTIELSDGHYQVEKTIVISKDHITMKSASGDPEKVILKGSGMKKTSGVNNLLSIMGKYTTLTGITLQEAGNHLIQLHGEKDADYFKMNNCILRDSWEQLFKVSYNPKSKVSADHGVIKNSLFEYSDGIGPQYYIGGIDMHGGKNWLIENNTFRNIASPSKHVAEHAIHIWKNSADNIVKNNIIVNCDRGVGFGLTDQWFRRNQGGEISGNIIIHHDNDHPFADAGIILENSPDTKVISNTVYMLHDYPNAIEYRFKETTDVVIISNTTNKNISSRDGASGLEESNITKSYASQGIDFMESLLR